MEIQQLNNTKMNLTNNINSNIEKIQLNNKIIIIIKFKIKILILELNKFQDWKI